MKLFSSLFRDPYKEKIKEMIKQEEPVIAFDTNDLSIGDEIYWKFFKGDFQVLRSTVKDSDVTVFQVETEGYDEMSWIEHNSIHILQVNREWDTLYPKEGE